ncbi:MAG: hypothetical protein ACRDQ4_14335 [Pseudonocardiaceae bacterium]
MNDYLPRWAAAVDAAQRPSPERLARAVATHLLDCGHSSGQLHRWSRALSREPDATLADLLTGASKLADQDDRDFEVMVPFVSVPDHQTLASHLPEWYSPPRAATWFAENKIVNALDSALRTAAPLIGAGLDRIVHSQLINRVKPLDLAARAENSLALASDPLGPTLTRLLE